MHLSGYICIYITPDLLIHNTGKLTTWANRACGTSVAYAQPLSYHGHVGCMAQTYASSSGLRGPGMTLITLQF